MNLASVWLELDGGDQEATRQGRTARAWGRGWGPNTVLLCADAAGAETRTHDATLRSGRLSTWPPMQPSWNFPTPVRHQNSTTSNRLKYSIGQEVHQQLDLPQESINWVQPSILELSSLPHSSNSDRPTKKNCSKAGGTMRLLR